MAASNGMRVTPSHSMQPTTSLHQWIVHTPTYGRSVASKPAGFGSYEAHCRFFRSEAKRLGLLSSVRLVCHSTNSAVNVDRL